VAFEGNLLKIETKEEDSMKMLANCAACTEPEGIWTLRVTPDRIEDLGHAYVNPVYPLVDDLLYRSQRGDDVSDMAAPRVAADLRASFTSTDGTQCGHFFVSQWGQTPVEHGEHLHATLDNCVGPSQLSLTIEYRGGKPYVTEGWVK
jgi:hypothetical protein